MPSRYFIRGKLIASSWLLAGLAVAVSGCQESDRGFLKKTYTNAEGEMSHYVVFAPAVGETRRKLPVILFLNGWGENGDDGLRQISNNFGSDVWRMRGHFPFLAVCPQCSYGGSWAAGSANAEKALAILDVAINEFGGDSERVYITGASAGGRGALQLASEYPNRFAAVVPVATRGGGDTSKLAAARIPIWSFYNGHDVKSLVDSGRAMRLALLEAGMSPLVTEFERGGHNAWDSAYGSPALYGWLLEQNTTNRVNGSFALLGPRDILATWKSTDADVWTTSGDELLADLGGRSSEVHLVSPPMADETELHLDVFLHRTARTRLVLMAAGTGEWDRVDVVLNLADTGLGEIRYGNEQPIALDPIGQRSLCVGWNDVRLARTQGHLLLTLNGWPAQEITAFPETQQVRWAIAVTRSEPTARLRYVRLYNPNASVVNQL
jgi:pimeloyl-ACP methyl ester carboxylesterase